MIVPILLDAQQFVRVNFNEIDYKNKIKIILRCEKLLIWKRQTGLKSCLIWVDYKEQKQKQLKG